MESHPAWVRGLKQIFILGKAFRRLSHPAWVRGLKHPSLHGVHHWHKVAPRVGAWIETSEFARGTSLA